MMKLTNKLPLMLVFYINTSMSFELDTYLGFNGSLSNFTNSCNSSASSCDNISSSLGLDIYGEVDDLTIGSSFSKFDNLNSTAYGENKNVSGYRVDVYGLINAYTFNDNNDLNIGLGVSNYYINYKNNDHEVDFSPSAIINYKYNFYSDLYVSPSYIFAYDIEGSNEHRFQLSFSKKVKYNATNENNHLNSKLNEEEESKIVPYEKIRITVDKYGVNEYKVKNLNVKVSEMTKDKNITSYILYGHSSTNENNQASFNRAKYIMDLLIDYGIEPNKIKIVDMKKDIHVSDNSVTIGELLSRRVTIEYYGVASSE